jgi:hypothetical protein
MPDRPKIETIEQVEARMTELSDSWRKKSDVMQIPTGVVLAQFAESFSVLACEVRALRERRG